MALSNPQKGATILVAIQFALLVVVPYCLEGSSLIDYFTISDEPHALHKSHFIATYYDTLAATLALPLFAILASLTVITFGLFNPFGMFSFFTALGLYLVICWFVWRALIAAASEAISIICKTFISFHDE